MGIEISRAWPGGWLAALPIRIHLTFDAGPAALEERGQATTVGQLDESIYLKAGHPVV
ncbi:hypothetical protein [Pseudomonas oryzihabitans]|uniref:hypothetical protein n=1 Tax=Pseudomonas oryzihabitans TaxID=47885 RepID=UPI001E16B04A|nr:hypothetical protein [Pseudomonas oryzihabitans]HJE70400.1 hypothetical protein [Pseudomonas oryzihabitans]